MLYLNLMIQVLARMMSTTKCLNTSLMMLCPPYSTFLITSGLRENSLQAGVLLQLYQFLNLVKIHLILLTIAQLLSQVAFGTQAHLSYAMQLLQTTEHYRSSGMTRFLCQRSFLSATTCCWSLF